MQLTILSKLMQLIRDTTRGLAKAVAHLLSALMRKSILMFKSSSSLSSPSPSPLLDSEVQQKMYQFRSQRIQILVLPLPHLVMLFWFRHQTFLTLSFRIYIEKYWGARLVPSLERVTLGLEMVSLSLVSRAFLKKKRKV